MTQTDLMDYVNVDYFEANSNSQLQECTSDLNEYVVVHHNNTDTETLSDSTVSNAAHHTVHTQVHSAMDDAVSSDGGHSDTATSTQLLLASLSAIQNKMEHSELSRKLTQASPAVQIKDMHCARNGYKHKLYKFYKLMMLICLMTVLGLIYGIHSHSMTPLALNSMSGFSSLSVLSNDYNEYNHDEYSASDESADTAAAYNNEYDMHQFRVQRNYYQYRYGYYHDYAEMNGNSMDRSEYDIAMVSYLSQLLIFVILFVVCFTSLQMFGFTQMSSKNE